MWLRKLFLSSEQGGGEGGGGGGGRGGGGGEGGGEGEEEEEEEEEKERRWRSELQCSLLYQCSRVVLIGQGNCFFPVNNEKMEEKGKEEEEEEEEEEIHNYNAVFRGNETELYSW